MSISSNPVALITGGSRGIGFGIAKALAKEGWNLAINGMRPQEDVLEALSELRSIGAAVVYCQGNIADEIARTQVIEQTRAALGALHSLINNAGITSPGRLDLLNATPEAFDQVMDVNLKGAFHLTQMAAKWMIEQRAQDPDYTASIVNISSVSGEFVSTDRGDYCMSWACLSATTKKWACRLAPHGISVYEIRPGIIRTDMTASVSDKYDRLISEGLTAEPRWGTPEDVGNAVAMLVTGQLTYATGNTIYVDGGLAAKQTW